MAVASTGRRHLTPGSRKVTEIASSSRAPLGAGGLVLQGFTVKLSGRPSGGYNSTGPKLRAGGAGTLKGSGPDANTILRRPTLKTGMRPTGRASGRGVRRASTSRPVLGPLRTRARVITS